MDPPSLESPGSTCWSKLPSDLLYSVFERLGFADFQRAKSVCSSWESISRQSAPNNQIPWLILFPEKGKDYCLLHNLEENDKIYKIRDLGVNFANSHCLVTYGSWLFMRDPRYDLYIFNIFTRERIDLPSLESELGMIKIERTTDDMFQVILTDTNTVWSQQRINIDSPLISIDEKTKDYVVMWNIHYRNFHLVHSRKGENFWKQTELFSTDNMVYNDHKLYLFKSSHDVKILDFSGDSPRQIFESVVKRKPSKMPNLFFPRLGDKWKIKKNHLVVTVTGEILKVRSSVRSDSEVWSFRIYKMDSSKNEWEKLTSLGDEAILLDLGVTVSVKAIEGVKRNSIYFCGDHRGYRFNQFARLWSEESIFIFNLDTHMVERPHQSICSSIQLSDARWFVPNFQRK